MTEQSDIDQQFKQEPMNTTTQQPTLKERQRAEREALILNAAERMLQEVGYQDLVMEALAERVGIGKGTIYLHFPSKEELVGAIIDRGTDRITATIASLAAEQGRSAYDRLHAVLTIFITNHPGWVHLLSGPGGAELHNVLQKRRNKDERLAELLAALGALIDEGKARGEFDARIASGVAALGLLSVVRTLSVPTLAGRIGLEPEAVAASSIRLYFHGLLARPAE